MRETPSPTSRSAAVVLGTGVALLALVRVPAAVVGAGLVGPAREAYCWLGSHLLPTPAPFSTVAS